MVLTNRREIALSMLHWTKLHQTTLGGILHLGKHAWRDGKEGCTHICVSDWTKRTSLLADRSGSCEMPCTLRICLQIASASSSREETLAKREQEKIGWFVGVEVGGQEEVGRGAGGEDARVGAKSGRTEDREGEEERAVERRVAECSVKRKDLV